MSLNFYSSAARYANEEAVGRAIAEFLKASQVKRDELFITTKLWDADHERAAEAIDESLQKLGLDYVDLFLIHSPGNLGPDARAKAWKDLEAAVDAGKVKSIGVSNVRMLVVESSTSRYLLINCSSMWKSWTTSCPSPALNLLSTKSNRTPSLLTKICVRRPLLVVSMCKREYAEMCSQNAHSCCF